MKKKILYVMGVEWNWILQRPQILALNLEKEYEITIIAPKQLIIKEKNINKAPKNIRYLYHIPLQEKSKIIRSISNIVNRNVFYNIYDYDAVWIGYPIYQRYIPKDYKGKIIYDCMDNFESLYSDRRQKAIQYVLEMEEELVCRANLVFASSNKLAEKMRAYKKNVNLFVVRNGCKDTFSKDIDEGEIKRKYTLGYVGTIAEWFDNKVLEKSLKDKRIQFRLIGPLSGQYKKIEHENVIYTGPIRHDKLYEEVKDIDCLIMPFLINDIILYVDPVKLYEYIAWGKCIVSSYYPEIERFEPYVYFYHSQEEYIELINELCKKGFPPKYNRKQQLSFLETNTWEYRMKIIEYNMRSLFEEKMYD